MEFVTNEKLTIVGAAGMIGSNMARDAYDCMIDLAEKTYNIPVRKNSGAK